MKLPSFLLNILFPSRCVICDAVTEKDVSLCKNCRPLLVHPATRKTRCEICGLSPEQCSCGKRRYYEKLAAPFLNEGDAKRSVYAIKFRHRTDKIKPFAEYMLRSLRERNLTEDADLITYIPMDRIKQFRRGYNQAELLAKALSEQSGIECVPLLTKYSKSETQHAMPSYLRRTGNLLGAYEPIKENTERFRNKTVILVDDISTTGSSFNEAAKTLLIFGADKVYCACAVMTKKKNTKKVE